MYTANTMSSAIEAMGMSLPYDASHPAVTAGKERESFQAGQAVVNLVNLNIRPRDIITRKSLENAYTFVLALGGSTNAVLHLMAIAREAGVEWTLDDFDRLGEKVPHLADLKPGGKYVMFDLYKAGGTPLSKARWQSRVTVSSPMTARCRLKSGCGWSAVRTWAVNRPFCDRMR